MKLNELMILYFNYLYLYDLILTVSHYIAIV